MYEAEIQYLVLRKINLFCGTGLNSRYHFVARTVSAVPVIARLSAEKLLRSELPVLHSNSDRKRVPELILTYLVDTFRRNFNKGN